MTFHGSRTDLPEGSIESLTVRIFSIERPQRSGIASEFIVELEDGSRLPLYLWEKHSIHGNFEIGQLYELENVYYEIRGGRFGSSNALNSTKDFQAKRTSLAEVETATKKEYAVYADTPTIDQTSSREFIDQIISDIESESDNI